MRAASGRRASSSARDHPQRPIAATGKARNQVQQVQQDRHRLDGIGLLSGLPPEALREIERQCRWYEFPANAKILDHDNGNRDVYFVVRGAVQVVNYSPNGRKIALARIAAGNYFGELAAIDGKPRSASVVALEDCLVATMAPSVCDQLVLDNPELAVDLLLRLANIIRSCDNRIMDLSTLGAVQRVYLELLGLAVRDPSGSDTWVISPVPAQREIASQASTARETVARAIGQLVAEGVVTREGKSLYIHDRARLEALVADLTADVGEDGVR